MSTDTTTAAGVRLTQLPKVDLLPPEIAEEAKFRTLRIALAGGVAASVVVVGVLWYSAHSGVSGAQANLVAAQTQQTTLQTKANSLAKVPQAYAQVATAESELTTAMGNEIRFSFVLNDIADTIPSKVWLTSLALTEDVDGTAPPVGPFGDPGVATMTVAGNGSNYPDVAAWLQELGGGKYYTDPYFSDAHEAPYIGKKSVIGFSSTVILTNKAYSNRYTNGSTR
jgi:Tfp pilus assembly protein PilN